MKIYTKTGDSGDTGLLGGPRVPKDDPRIEACGTVDELNAALGLARAARTSSSIDAVLARIQHELFTLGAELAVPGAPPERGCLISEQLVTQLEQSIDQFEDRLPPLENFILPGGSGTAAALHLARSICRRAERRVVTLRNSAELGVSDLVVRYLNRLGDLLFVLARAANASQHQADVVWQKP